MQQRGGGAENAREWITGPKQALKSIERHRFHASVSRSDLKTILVPSSPRQSKQEIRLREIAERRGWEVVEV
jgi:hypothetical protein